jgi:hypothetical protein
VSDVGGETTSRTTIKMSTVLVSDSPSDVIPQPLHPITSTRISPAMRRIVLYGGRSIHDLKTVLTEHQRKNGLFAERGPHERIA